MNSVDSEMRRGRFIAWASWIPEHGWASEGSPNFMSTRMPLGRLTLLIYKGELQARHEKIDENTHTHTQLPSVISVIWRNAEFRSGFNEGKGEAALDSKVPWSC